MRHIRCTSTICNEFGNLLGDDNYVLYADDTSLVYSGKDLNQLASHVNGKLSLIYEWCNYNKLSLNPEKSEFMIISSHRFTNPPLIQIDYHEVKMVNCAKYLGVFLDDHIKYHDHIQYVENKLVQLCGASYRLKKHFNKSTALNFYYSCVYSVFNYCLCVWGGVSLCTTRCNRIASLQKRILKNLFCECTLESDDIFKSMRILKFIDVYKLRVAIFMFRIIKLGEFPQLKLSLNLVYPDHSHETRHRNSLITPFPRIESIRMNFKYQLSKIYNEVPIEIKESSSVYI